MAALERAIESLTDPSVSVADALRGLLVVGRRIGADHLTDWIKGELDGYGETQTVPEYRQIGQLPVRLQFDGYGGSRDVLSLAPRELPDHLSSAFKDGALRQPVAELAALCGPDVESNPRLNLPMAWVMEYRRLAEQDQVPHDPMMVLNGASLSLPRTHLEGIVDRVKSAALDLALGLEDVSMDAGAPGGPTVETEPRLQTAVTVHMQHIFATNSSVVIGDGASVTQVQIGDVAGLLEAARSLLSEEGVTALGGALERDGGQPAEETRSVLARVRSGAYVLGSGLATNGAYDGLVALLGQVFPGVSI